MQDAALQGHIILRAFRGLRKQALFIVQLLCIHLILAQGWFSAGLRKAFTSREHVHYMDLQKAWEATKPIPHWSILPPEVKGGGSGQVALLFMLRTRLEQLETWRLWLSKECCYDGRNGPAPISLYFHFADGVAAVNSSHLEKIRTMPGFRRVVPTVYTGWCELMAAEVAMLATALEDNPQARAFVFLPHDAVPLVPLPRLRDAVLSEGGLSEMPPSKICNSGVRGLDMPSTCAHSIEPHWARQLLLKHHQWMSLNRDHAKKLTDQRRLKVASSIFWDDYISEPLCSDELLPLLALALPDKFVTDEIASSIKGHSAENRMTATERVRLSDLPLYQHTFEGLEAFNNGLAELNINSECIMYAPWPGCDEALAKVGMKRARSPIVGGGLTLPERGALMGHLVDRGLLVCRKLGLWGGTPQSHVKFVHEHQPQQNVPVGPARVLPEVQSSASWWSWIRWQISGLEAYMSKMKQVLVAALLLSIMLWFGGCSDSWKIWFMGCFSACHIWFFAVSIWTSEELSVHAPFVGREILVWPAALSVALVTLRMAKPPHAVLEDIAEGNYPIAKKIFKPFLRHPSSPCRQVFPKDSKESQ
mmetsp:Transcript_60432/g.112230  ORF Transcript_60432/g.112230 Transcript_60432/m.112230 type:complete len:590 (-) Transcript_60432:85-1854(-)